MGDELELTCEENEFMATSSLVLPVMFKEKVRGSIVRDSFHKSMQLRLLLDSCANEHIKQTRPPRHPASS